jgi:aminopeptidase N
VIALMLVGLLAGSPASPAADPYFPLDGNSGYDVEHYRIVDGYRPGTDRLRGTTKLRATATEELTAFQLDLVLPVDRVLVDGTEAGFSKPNRHELLVEPSGTLEPGDRFTVTVDYHGRPGSVEAAGDRPGTDLYFHQDGETVAMGEPQNGAWWFAANETPQDAATYDITVRVPRGTEAISGGERVSRQRAHGLVDWHWRLTTAVPSYQVFFAAGDYRLERGEVEGRPFLHAVSRKLASDQQDLVLQRLRLTEKTVAWFADRLGEYPFTETGGVAIGLPAGYALETATRPVYPAADLLRPGWQGLIVHEIAHQWFGDDVVLRRWRDVWLNEGFATYAEWWSDEAHGGRRVEDRLHEIYDSVPVDDKFWQVQVSDPGAAQMWSRAVYVRGAMTLAALRARIGTPALDTLLSEWVARFGGGHATGEELRSLAEEVSGQDLAAFFQHWLDDTRRPDANSENGLAGEG